MHDSCPKLEYGRLPTFLQTGTRKFSYKDIVVLWLGMQDSNLRKCGSHGRRNQSCTDIFLSNKGTPLGRDVLLLNYSTKSRALPTWRIPNKMAAKPLSIFINHTSFAALRTFIRCHKIGRIGLFCVNCMSFYMLPFVETKYLL